MRGARLQGNANSSGETEFTVAMQNQGHHAAGTCAVHHCAAGACHVPGWACQEVIVDVADARGSSQRGPARFGACFVPTIKSAGVATLSRVSRIIVKTFWVPTSSLTGGAGNR
eukprot:5592748-Alexandrium_andersonii.AAC.1